MRLGNQKGFTGLEIAGVIAIVAFIGVYVLKTGNPFDRSADPSNRRTATELSGRDVVDITKAVAAADGPVSVHVDRSIESKSEVTDPKLTIQQKIGRFFAGLSTWTFFLIGGACLLIPGFGGWLLWRARTAWKDAFKLQVGAVRDIEDEETYKKVTKSIAKRQEIAGKHGKRAAKLVDVVKAELH